ncbi:hypothetical protein C8F01DRAFT_510206 [Mycena amicta]|nr:hypothetical protein C8F01DRAFT_510206 [Mycena amicta]
MNVRKLALGDWAWGRILDGRVTPADVYYLVRVKGGELPDIGICATHPVPWTISPPPSPPAAPTRAPARHPGTVRPYRRPCSQTSHILRTYSASAADAECRQATRNGMRLGCGEMDLEEKKVVDPVIRAARMSLEDVVRELREEEGVWFEGVDWSERRGMREQKPRRKYGGEDGRKKIHRPVAVGHHPGRQSRRCCRHRR